MPFATPVFMRQDEHKCGTAETALAPPDNSVRHRPGDVSDSSPDEGSPFDSFWMGGFEGADHVNGLGAELDMARANGHLDQLEADHARAAALGIGCIRESIGWRLCEPSPHVFDTERVLRIAQSARRHGLQVIWTFMHYGTPPDVTLLDDSFCDRFVQFAVAMARTVGPVGARPPVYNLINEISFLAWAVSETNLMHPYRSDPHEPQRRVVSGFDVKRRLVRATLVATAAIRAIDASARFLQVEPVIHVTAPANRPDLAALAADVDGYQWQVWDMLAAGRETALGQLVGGLDLVGLNHYHCGQWEVGTQARLDWYQRDPRRRPLSSLLVEAWSRYQRPLIVAETSHVGEGRAQWLHEIASEVTDARQLQVPVHGICLYPLVDRPDWNAATHWHRSGLWDVDERIPDGPAGPNAAADDLPLRRVLSVEYARALRLWQQILPTSSIQKGTPMKCLIVFSHLRWSFVFQRPQHLLSRLSRHYRIIFIEEPVHTEAEARLDRIVQGPNIEVLVPYTPVGAAGFHDDQLATLEPLLSDYFDKHWIEDPIVWFYTPMALPLLTIVKPAAVIYDCMDELSAFKNAPRQLRQRETALLKRADLVLTGGPSLFEAKRRLHHNVHCLPSSVDAVHYSPDRLDMGSAPAHDARLLQDHIASPRLGYFGVIDERFDVDLLKLLAQVHPDWQFVMVGPVVKIDLVDLPNAANIHWLGMQAYERLPYLMAGWDVCLMPFAMNESTRFISPTKTLEYMAGEKPVVSTPVGDVVALYGEAVRIAAAGPDFVLACEEAMAESSGERQQRVALMQTSVNQSSWDRSAARVHDLIEGVLEDSHAQAAPSTFAKSSDSAPVAAMARPARAASAG